MEARSPSTIELGKAAIRPQVASNDSGAAVVVWREREGERAHVRAKLFEPTTGWGPATSLNHGRAKFVMSTDVALDAKGRAIAVWSEGDGTTRAARSRQQVWASRFADGQWSEPVSIGSTADAFYPGGHGPFPVISMAPLGDAVAVWQRREGDRYDAWASAFSPGRGWSRAVSIEDNTGDAVRPRVALADDGAAVVVWQQWTKEDSYRRPSHSDVWSNRFEIGHGWQGPQLIEADDAGSAEPPALAVSPDGVATVAWIARGTTDSHDHVVWANRYVPKQGWDPAQIIQTERGQEGWGYEVRVSASRSSDAVVVWEQTRRATKLWTRRYRRGRGWQLPVSQSTPVTAARFATRVAGNSRSVLRAWVGRDRSIWLATREGSSGWMPPQQLAQGKKMMVTPAVDATIDELGNVTVAWQDSDGAWVQRSTSGSGERSR